MSNSSTLPVPRMAEDEEDTTDLDEDEDAPSGSSSWTLDSPFSAEMEMEDPHRHKTSSSSSSSKTKNKKDSKKDKRPKSSELINKKNQDGENGSSHGQELLLPQTSPVTSSIVSPRSSSKRLSSRVEETSASSSAKKRSTKGDTLRRASAPDTSSNINKEVPSLALNGQEDKDQTISSNAPVDIEITLPSDESQLFANFTMAANELHSTIRAVPKSPRTRRLSTTLPESLSLDLLSSPSSPSRPSTSLFPPSPGCPPPPAPDSPDRDPEKSSSSSSSHPSPLITSASSPALSIPSAGSRTPDLGISRLMDSVAEDIPASLSQSFLTPSSAVPSPTHSLLSSSPSSPQAQPSSPSQPRLNMGTAPDSSIFQSASLAKTIDANEDAAEQDQEPIEPGAGLTARDSALLRLKGVPKKSLTTTLIEAPLTAREKRSDPKGQRPLQRYDSKDDFHLLMPRRPLTSSPSGTSKTTETVDLVSGSSSPLTSSPLSHHLVDFPVPSSPSKSRLVLASPSKNSPKFLKKRDEVLKELIDTEYNYVLSLSSMIHVYLMPLKEKEILSETRIRNIFSNIQDILPINCELLQILNNFQRNSPSSQYTSLSQIFDDYASRFKSYAIFCSNHSISLNEKRLKTYQDENKKFARFLTECQMNPECKNQQLSGFLIMPMQRLCRYPMLISEYKKCTSPDDPEYEQLGKTIDKMREIVQLVNDETQAATDVAHLIELEKTFEFPKEWDFSLVFPGRHFVMEGPFRIVRPHSDASYAFLFSDVLILTKPRSILNVHKAKRVIRLDRAMILRPPATLSLQIAELGVNIIRVDFDTKEILESWDEKLRDLTNPKSLTDSKTSVPLTSASSHSSSSSSSSSFIFEETKSALASVLPLGSKKTTAQTTKGKAVGDKQMRSLQVPDSSTPHSQSFSNFPISPSSSPREKTLDDDTSQRYEREILLLKDEIVLLKSMISERDSEISRLNCLVPIESRSSLVPTTSSSSSSSSSTTLTDSGSIVPVPPPQPVSTHTSMSHDSVKRSRSKQKDANLPQNNKSNSATALHYSGPLPSEISITTPLPSPLTTPSSSSSNLSSAPSHSSSSHSSSSHSSSSSKERHKSRSSKAATMKIDKAKFDLAKMEAFKAEPSPKHDPDTPKSSDSSSSKTDSKNELKMDQKEQSRSGSPSRAKTLKAEPTRSESLSKIETSSSKTDSKDLCADDSKNKKARRLRQTSASPVIPAEPLSSAFSTKLEFFKKLSSSSKLTDKESDQIDETTDPAPPRKLVRSRSQTSTSSVCASASSSTNSSSSSSSSSTPTPTAAEVDKKKKELVLEFMRSIPNEPESDDLSHSPSYGSDNNRTSTDRTASSSESSCPPTPTSSDDELSRKLNAKKNKAESSSKTEASSASGDLLDPKHARRRGKKGESPSSSSSEDLVGLSLESTKKKKKKSSSSSTKDDSSVEKKTSRHKSTPVDDATYAIRRRSATLSKPVRGYDPL